MTVYLIKKKNIEYSCLMFIMSSTKREIRKFHVVVMQKQLRNLQKLLFANPDLLLFFNFAVLVAIIVVVALASYFMVEPPSSRLNKISDL